MASVSVTNTFVANTTASASQVNQNFSDLVNYINNRNSGASEWDSVSILNASSVPLTVNNSTGTSNIANFQDNGSNVFSIADGGLITQDGGAVFNEAGADKDFRIEGDTESNTFFVDASADSVGLATNTPSARLHVIGNTTTGVACLINNNTSTGNILTLQDNGVVAHFFGDGGSVVFNENGASTGDVRMEGDLESNLFFLDASLDEIGVGTGTPTAKLHVLAAAGGSEVACLINNNTSTGNILTLSDGGSVVHAFGDGSSVVFNETGAATGDVRMEGDTESNLFFLDASADEVGIGNGTPTAKLHVIAAGGGTEVAMKINGNTSTGDVLNVQDNGSNAFSVADNKNIVCNSAAIATNATDGFLYIASCAGTPTGVPTSFTGRTALVYDSSNNRIYFYNGAWRSVAVA